MVGKRSGLQKDVLSIYRKILRAAIGKDREQLHLRQFPVAKLLIDSTSSTSYAGQEFRKQAGSVKRSEFKKIEFMIRKGEKQLKLLSMPGVTVVGGV